MEQWITSAGAVAGAVTAVLALVAALWRPVKKMLKKRAEFREMVLEKLDAIMDDIADLQYERLSQAQDFYTSRGWCPGAKKEMLCKMHASYRAKGRNHLSEHYEEEILRLADKPEKEEDA